MITATTDFSFGDRTLVRAAACAGGWGYWALVPADGAADADSASAPSVSAPSSAAG
jgi:hypothetical protein